MVGRVQADRVALVFRFSAYDALRITELHLLYHRERFLQITGEDQFDTELTIIHTHVIECCNLVDFVGIVEIEVYHGGVELDVVVGTFRLSHLGSRGKITKIDFVGSRIRAVGNGKGFNPHVCGKSIVVHYINIIVTVFCHFEEVVTTEIEHIVQTQVLRIVVTWQTQVFAPHAYRLVDIAKVVVGVNTSCQHGHRESRDGKRGRPKHSFDIHRLMKLIFKITYLRIALQNLSSPDAGT